MNERPFILTIIAALLLVSSAGVLFDLLAVADIEHWPISRVLAAAVHCAVTGLCGVGILKGWPWARVLCFAMLAVLLLFFPQPWDINPGQVRKGMIVSKLALIACGCFLFSPGADEWFAAKGLRLRRSGDASHGP